MELTKLAQAPGSSGTPAPTCQDFGPPLILGHPISDVYRWKAEYDMRHPYWDDGDAILNVSPADAPEYESGTWSQAEAATREGVAGAAAPGQGTHWAEGCQHPGCILPPHGGDDHEDWLGVFNERAVDDVLR